MTEAKIYEFLLETLPQLSNPIIFEIGLHRGVDTEKIFNICNNPQYYGFEPDPRNIEVFKKTELYKKITFVEMAIANYNGDGGFYQSSGTPSYHNIQNTCSSSLYKPKEHLKRWPWTKFKQRFKVPVSTLDNYCTKNNIDHIDFMWSDIQGGEYYMILGAQEILRKTKYVFMEYEDAELYEGHKALSEIMSALPGKWVLLKNYGAEILVKNTEI